MTSNASQVVKAAYNLLLNREPDPGGLSYWEQALEGGLPQTDFVRAVLNSPEFKHSPGSVDVTTLRDVDLVIPVNRYQFRVPATDVSVVPHLLAQRCWEPHIMGFLARELQPAHVFLDVGANIGYFTVQCAALVHRVVAFEPVAKAHGYCAMNIEMNGLRNVELRQCALWHEDALLEIRSDESCLGSSSVAAVPGETSLETIRGVSLDNLVRCGNLDLPRLDVVKMDIEGAELSALTGMRDTIARLRPKVVMEINRPALAAFGSTVDDVWAWLKAIDYEIRAFHHWKDREPSPVATLEELTRLCPADALLDVVASPEGS